MKTLHFLCLSLLLSLNACSYLSSESSSALPPAFDLIELSATRSSLSGVEFEQMKLEGDSLFAECGQLLRGKYQSKAGDLIDISVDRRQRLVSAAGLLWQALENEKLFPEVGTNSDFADPGQFSLKIVTDGDTRSLSTSFDAISTPTSLATRRALGLYELLRGHASGRADCGNALFFGVRGR